MTLNNLRRDIPWRSQERASDTEQMSIARICLLSTRLDPAELEHMHQAKSGHLQAPILVQDDIRGTQSAMNKAFAMSKGQSCDQLFQQRQSFAMLVAPVLL